MRCVKFIFLLLFSIAGFAQTVPLSDNARISVLTCDVGNEVYSLFGHTAIRITDPATGIDVVYNYGMFDFDTPNFVAKFAKGDLQYFVAVNNYQDFIYQYVAEQRSVYEQVLNLTSTQKQQLFDRLNTVLASDEKYYTYKFIDRNCTNMAVDVINEVLGQDAIVKTDNTDITYRSVLYPYFNGHFYEQLGTSIIFGTKVDQKATLLFLPGEFMNSLEVTKINGKPIAEKKEILLEYKTPESNGTWWNNIYTYIALLLVVAIANKRPLTYIYFTILGLIGCFFSIAGAYSLHEELAYNYNVLLLNPWLLVIIYLQITKRQLWLNRVAVAAIAMIAVYFIIMLNKIHLFIVLPMILVNLYLLGRIYRSSKQSKK
ncbi:MAG TPA: DUF4105 domain-containing protein [Flavobacterium sp.]